MKQHFFWALYLLTIVCVGGWYIKEQKVTIAEQKTIIQELTASQRPPIVPEERKIKYVEKIVEKKVTVKDEQCIQEYEKLKQQTLQCAYNLKFCQESSDVYNRMIPQEKQNGK